MALVIYFLSKIINAKVKLEERRIGTLISTVHSETVQGHHIICHCYLIFYANVPLMFLQSVI